MKTSTSKQTIHIDSSTSITRLITNGVIKYNNEKYPVYEHNGKYKIDLDRPARDALDLHSEDEICLLYTSPSPRDKRQSRMPSSA